MKIRNFAAFTVFALLVAAFAYAQQPMVIVKVPFQFTVGDKVLPAGQYRIAQQDEPDLNVLRIENMANRSTIFAQVLTRLAMQRADLSAVTFDKVGETYRLSEIWIPGTDGFLITNTAEKHTHHTIKPER